MENIIEQMPASESEATPTIGEAEMKNDTIIDAVPLGEATPDLIKEATKESIEDDGVKTIGDEIKEQSETTETKGEEAKKETAKKEDDPKTEEGDESPNDEFQVPKDTVDEVAAEQEEESSWIKAGKEVGIELKADDFEEFKSALQQKETAAYEKGKSEAAKIELEKYSPEAQKLIEFLNSDPKASVDDFVNPLREMDAVLALDDEGIVRKDLELKGWDSDKIDDRIELLEKNGALDNTAYELRKIVEGNKEVVKTELVESKKHAALERQNQYTAEVKKENEQIKSVIEKTDTFLDRKLNKEVKDFLYKKWETGEYRKLMQTNPDIAVKSMINHYLGEQAAKELKKESFQKGRDNIQEKLHNLEQIGNGGETSGRKATKTSFTNHFSAWEEAMNSGEGITT